MIQRPAYLNQLLRHKDRDLIKVVTGMRRCGKTVLLFELFAQKLLETFRRNGSFGSTWKIWKTSRCARLKISIPTLLLKHRGARAGITSLLMKSSMWMVLKMF